MPCIRKKPFFIPEKDGCFLIGSRIGSFLSLSFISCYKIYELLWKPINPHYPPLVSPLVVHDHVLHYRRQIKAGFTSRFFMTGKTKLYAWRFLIAPTHQMTYFASHIIRVFFLSDKQKCTFFIYPILNA